MADFIIRAVAADGAAIAAALPLLDVLISLVREYRWIDVVIVATEAKRRHARTMYALEDEYGEENAFWLFHMYNHNIDTRVVFKCGIVDHIRAFRAAGAAMPQRRTDEWLIAKFGCGNFAKLMAAGNYEACVEIFGMMLGNAEESAAMRRVIHAAPPEIQRMFLLA